MTFCAPLSLHNRTWEARPIPEAIDAPAWVHPIPAALAAARGVTDLHSFFQPSFRASMPDPTKLKDMDRAIARISDALVAGERIGIIGDYDVDGATSTALLVRLFRMLGHENVVFRIPHRISEGYGPNEALVESMRVEDRIEVLMIVDSGTAALGPIAHAKSLGLDVVVLDHHEAGSEMPDCILVNPKRPEEDKSLEYLCTVGLAFLFGVGLFRELRNRGYTDLPDIRKLLGLVALGTVADVVPLVGLNRAYVSLGLEKMSEIVGIKALCAVTGEEKFTAHSCGFVFGPCLNAAGRIDDMMQSVELLLTEDPDQADVLAQHLHGLNQERQKMQKAAVEAAKERVMADANPGQVIVAYDEAWHPGVVGLIASKIKDAFDKPAVIIGTHGKGSCRTVDGFNIGAAIIAAREAGILEKGGGHAMAAGLTIDPARLQDLQQFLDARAEGFVHPPIDVDMVFRCGELTPEIVKSFEQLAPFGQGNKTPLVAVVGGFIRKVSVLKGLHVKAWFSGPDGDTVAMIFNGIDTPIGQALINAEGRYVDAYGKADCDTYNGIENVLFKPKDLIIGMDLEAAAAA